MTPKKLNNSQEKEVCDRYAQGETGGMIAKRFAVCPGVIYSTLSKLHIACRTGQNKETYKSNLLDRDGEKISQRYLSGDSLRTIAKDYQIKADAIARCLRRMDVEIRTRSEARQNADALFRTKLKQIYIDEPHRRIVISAEKRKIPLDKWDRFVSPENTKIRNSSAYRSWRNKIFSRDKKTCRKCGNNEGRLFAHHIRPFARFPELRLDENNGITLCRRCHESVRYKEDDYIVAFEEMINHEICYVQPIVDRK